MELKNEKKKKENFSIPSIRLLPYLLPNYLTLERKKE